MSRRDLVAERSRLRQQLEAAPAPDAPHSSAVYRAWVKTTAPWRKRVAEIDALVPPAECFKPRPATEADVRIAKKFKQAEAVLFAAKELQ